MVYGHPETVSDVYVNRRARPQKGGRLNEDKGGVCKHARPWFTSAVNYSEARERVTENKQIYRQPSLQ